MTANIDDKVVGDFGREWSKFDQSYVPAEELSRSFSGYFAIFPWEDLSPNARGFDLGCGSGRWAQFVAPHVGELHCIDPAAEALEVAKRLLHGFGNCRFHLAGVDDMPMEEDSMDFGYSLGVLHHVPDTLRGIQRCVAKLRPGAPLLLYLYYAFDNKPFWFRWVWKASDALRRAISESPFAIKYIATQIIAVLVYVPLARMARLAEKTGLPFEDIPLSQYRDKSFYTMRTDALDRFGTRIEKRFTRRQIEEMMRRCGLIDIKFSDHRPYWCAVGRKDCPANRST